MPLTPIPPLLPPLVVALGVLVVAQWVHYGSPHRALNRIFVSLAVHVALWLFALQIAFTLSLDYGNYGSLALRTARALAAFFPLHLWLVQQSITEEGRTLGGCLWRARWWAGLSGLLGAFCFTPWFVPTSLQPDLGLRVVPEYPLGYYLESAGVMLGFALVMGRGAWVSRRSQGARRLELQVFLLGGGVGTGAVLLLVVLRYALGLPWLARLQPTVIGLVVTGTMFAMNRCQVFAPGELTRAGLRATALGLAVVLPACVLDGWTHLLAWSEPIGLILAALAGAGVARFLEAPIDHWLRLAPDLREAQTAALGVAHSTASPDVMEMRFRRIICQWGHCPHALVAQGDGILLGEHFALKSTEPVVTALRVIHWVTPERLARDAHTPEREALEAFLAEQGIEVAVLSADGTLLLGAACPPSLRPYTFPQVAQLLTLAAIMESAFERARFIAKTQRDEQLAAVGLLGTGLIREIRNPLTAISTLAGLQRTQTDPRLRAKFSQLTLAEVQRIEQLTTQLLQLGPDCSCLAPSLCAEPHPPALEHKLAENRVESPTRDTAAG